MATAAADSTRYIYKIVPGSPPLPIITGTGGHGRGQLSSTFILPSSSLDINSGFLHMSRASQVPGTLRHFFAAQKDRRDAVYLLRVDYAMLAERMKGSVVVRWESPDASICGPRDDEGMFPHIYLSESEKARTVGDGKGDGMLARLGGAAAAAARNEGGGESESDTQRPVVVEVESIVEVVSEVGDEGWENALNKLKDWLV